MTNTTPYSSGIASESLPKLMQPYTAVKKLEHYCGGSFAAKQLIADKIRDGEIGAFALRSWISDQPSLKKARGERPDVADVKTKIKPSILVGAESWTENVASWKWRVGDFHSVIRSKPMRRRVFRKVRLVAEDVLRLVAAREALFKSEQSKRGRRPKIEAWNTVWMEVLRIAVEERFTKDHLPTMSQFRAKVAKAVVGSGADGPLDEETFAPLLNHIYRRFVDPKAN